MQQALPSLQIIREKFSSLVLEKEIIKENPFILINPLNNPAG